MAEVEFEDAAGGSSTDPVPGPPPGRIIPSLHLARMLATPEPIVCVAGDSKAGASCDSLVPEDSVWGILRDRFGEDNPGRRFSFVNRAVAAQTWNTFNDVVRALWPDWYFDHELPWLPYVQAVQADVLVLGLGINDNAGLAATQIAAVLSKIAGWGRPPDAVARNTSYGTHAVLLDPDRRLVIVSRAGTTAAEAPGLGISVGHRTTDGTATLTLLDTRPYAAKVPDIVLLSNENANPEAHLTADRSHQLGTLASAAFVRGVATTDALGFTADGGRIPGLPPLGLIDVGRHFTMAVAGAFSGGFDPLDRYFAEYDGPLPELAREDDALPPTPAPDFQVELSVPNGASFGLRHAFGLATSSPGRAHPTAVSLLTDGHGVLVAVTNATSFAQQRYTPQVWNGGVNTIEIIKHRTRIRLLVNGVVGIDTHSQFFDRPGFRPFLVGALPENTVIGVARFTVSRYGRRYRPLVTAAQCWGDGSGRTNGNGINHTASHGLSTVVAPVFEATRLGA